MILKHLCLLALLASTLSACTTLNLENQFPRRDSRDMLGVGLTYINRAYVQELELGDVTVAGLRGLKAIEPNLGVARSPRGLQTRVASVVREYPVADQTDPIDWARASNAAIEGLRLQSPRVAQVQPDEIYRLVFEGFETELDQFSRYLEPDEASNEDERFLGFGGIGINIDNEPAGIRVVNVMRRSPADKGGLKKGDLIVAVNGKPFVANGKLRDRARELKGPVGSRVAVTVRRGLAGQLSTFSLLRDEVVGESVELEVENDIAFLRILTFNKNTSKRVMESITEANTQLRSQGRTLKGAVLDVRDNGGGLRTAVIDVADVVLQSGTITRTQGRLSSSNKTFEAKGRDLLNGLPIIVEINESSASASELLAAALQDNGRAVVIGSTSYGKGSVQSKLPLPNNGEIALTTARFYGPSGVPLHDYGVVPTVCTSDNTLGASALLADIFASRRGLAAAAARRAINGTSSLSLAQYRAFCPPSEATPDRDDELATAILSQPSIYATLLKTYANNSR